MQIDRRRFLGTTVTLGALSVAGCSQDGGNSDENDEGDTDAGQQSTDTSGSGLTTEMGSTAGGQGDVSGDADLTLALAGGNMALGGTNTDFEEVTVRFDAFEFRNEGETVRREGTGAEIDLTGLNMFQDLMDVTVPAGSYTEAAWFIPVVSATTADGSDETDSFSGDDPAVVDLSGFDGFSLEPGSTQHFGSTLNLQPQFSGDGWTFMTGYQTY